MTQKRVSDSTELNISIFRERFIKLREEHKMSQAQFAVFLGIPSGSVGGYENGTKFPNGKTLFTIATKCEVSADYLLGLQDNPVLKEDLKMICNYTGLSGKAVEVLAFLKESGNVENIETINKIIESIYPKALEWLGIAEISEDERNNLFSALTWYLSSAFESNTDKIHVTKSGKIKDYNSTSREYTKTAFADTDDLKGLFEINSGEIVEQVLLNKIIEELKKEKRR